MVGRAGAVRPCGPLSPACAARAPMEQRPVCHSGRMHSPDPLLMAAAGAERIVVVRAVTQAEDPEAAARTLRAGLPD